MSNLSDEERRERIDNLMASIRETCGMIQTHVENLDPEATDDELNEMYDWAEEVSAATYKWSDE